MAASPRRGDVTHHRRRPSPPGAGKHRAGETDTIRLAWLPEYTLFANLAKDAVGTPVYAARPEKGDVSL